MVPLLRAASDVGVLDWEVCKQLVASVGISCLIGMLGCQSRDLIHNEHVTFLSRVVLRVNVREVSCGGNR